MPGGIHSRPYDGVVYEWAAGSTTMMGNEQVEVHDGLAARIAALAPARVLDVGCGFGRTVLALAKVLPGATIAGCDLSEPALRLAHRHAVCADATIELARARAEDLARYPDGSFNVVTATMLAVVVINPTKGPRRSAGQDWFSGQRPYSGANCSAAAAPKLR